MTFGARNFGVRSFGDTAPAGAGVLATGAAAGTGTASFAFGTMDVAGTGHVVKNGSGSLAFGTMQFGTAASPGGGTAGGEVAVRNFRPITLPFEYPLRFADNYDILGLTVEQAEWFEHRDREIERYIAESMPDLVFSLPGPVTPSTSPRFRSRLHYRIDSWIASLDTAGSTTTTLWVLRSGVRTVKIELGSGVNEVEVPRYTLLDKGTDYVQVEVETPGTGATDLTVQGLVRH